MWKKWASVKRQLMLAPTGLMKAKTGGRACWAISGTFCAGKIEGTFAINFESCLQCEFYRLVSVEEGLDFLPTKALLNILSS